MNKEVIIGLGMIVAVGGGCASQTNWAPTVDAQNDPRAAQIESDLTDCRQLALQAGSDSGAEAAKGGAVGGFIGAATGAIIGLITGNAGSGAAVGAVTGGVGGAAQGGLGSDDEYKRAYVNCMRSRGHNVIN